VEVWVYSGAEVLAFGAMFVPLAIPIPAEAAPALAVKAFLELRIVGRADVVLAETPHVSEGFTDREADSLEVGVIGFVDCGDFVRFWYFIVCHES
jgi:hypothetical protein